MNQRPPQMPPRGPRPQQGPRQGPKLQHWNYSPYPYYFPGHEYEYYDYDYNWDQYDWDYLAANKAKEGTPMPPKSSESWTDYQQGFKDGWKAAMETLIYGAESSETINVPTPMPAVMPPVPMPEPVVAPEPTPVMPEQPVMPEPTPVPPEVI